MELLLNWLSSKFKKLKILANSSSKKIYELVANQESNQGSFN